MLFWRGLKGGKPVGASGNVGFFFSQATSFEICFDQDQTLSGCQRGSTHVDSKSISLGMILAFRIQGRSLAPKVAASHADLRKSYDRLLGRLLLKKLLPCLRPPSKQEERCVTTEGTTE